MRLTDEQLDEAVEIRQALAASCMDDVADSLQQIDEEDDDIDDLKLLEDTLRDIETLEDGINDVKWRLEGLIRAAKKSSGGS